MGWNWKALWSARKDAALLLHAGILGVLIFFCVKTSCLIGSTAGSSNFVSWVSMKAHGDLFRKSGERRGERAFTRRLFRPSDVKDAAALARRLRQPQTPLERFLREQLSEGTRRLLAGGEGAPEASGQLRAALTDDLNRLLQGPSLYQKERFAGTDLHLETKYLLVLRKAAPQADFPELADQELKEDAETRLLTAVDANRKLLEDAFQEQISGVPPGGTVFMNAAPHVKLRYHLLRPTVLAFVLGVLAGGAVLGLRALRRRRAGGADGAPAAAPAEAAGNCPAPEFAVPAWCPPCLAALGVFFYGHFWGLVAYVLAGRTRAPRWARRLSRALAVLTATYWGVGTELYWTDGWSKIYPAVNHFLKNIFGLFGVSF